MDFDRQSSDVAFKHDPVHRFIDNEHSEWTMAVTSPEGKVVLELSAKQTRRKKQGHGKPAFATWQGSPSRHLSGPCLFLSDQT